ncbi:MAG: serine/threonine-protein kinase [Myxococcota bacterium]
MQATAEDVPEGLWIEPGSEFRGLRVHGALARGAMGVAYLASHDVLKRPLILKLFTPQGSELFAEAELAARVTSPHVVGVLDAGVEAGRPFLVQRYVDGVDLHELMGHGVQETGCVARMIADVARGLAAIHRAGVVHRDIKPANLFLSGDGRALLGDFGIARDRSRVDNEPAAGTPLFLAPEIWDGGPPSRAADLYALGCTAHLLATGKSPFIGKGAQLRLAHMTQPYVVPPQDDPERAYLFTTIAKLLAKSPQDRVAHAEGLVRTLSRIETQAPELRSHGFGVGAVGGMSLFLRRGNLATASADVIVNAAYPHLTMDLGVSEALVLAAGRAIEDEAVVHAPCSMGEVVWTSAGALDARHVAHAVAALDGAICIQRATLRTLLGARKREARSIAFPALGTGVGQVPHALGAKLMLEAIQTFAALGPRPLEKIEIWLYDEAAYVAWRDVLDES